MRYLDVCFIFFLYGFSQVYGFFQFRHRDYLFRRTTSLSKVNNSDCESHSALWIDQPLDHFNESDQRTFKMKYYEITDAWKPGGPIVLQINGEGPLLPYFPEELQQEEHESFIWEIVKTTNGAFFMLEHRYYGDTQPFDEQTTENLAFLSSRQALADIALFLQTIKGREEYKNSKTIVEGGSYAGNLAAWIKLLYPDLVDAALASSAPVLAKKDFCEYVETVTETFRTYGSRECVNKITKKFNRFHELLQTAEGIEQLRVEENICEDVNMSKHENQFAFFTEKFGIYAFASQYGTPRSIAYYCQNNTFDEDFINDLQTGVWNSEIECNSYNFDDLVQSSDRAWVYQTCTEFGYYASTTSSKQMFGCSMPVEYYYKICSGLFGEQFTEQRVDEGIANTNKMYGGLTPNVKNVVFTNGDMDPWHRLGIIEDLSVDSPAIHITGSSHCKDLDVKSDDDSKSLKDARERIKKLLIGWIEESN